MQRFRADEAGETYPNGSVPWFSKWNVGPSLALVKKCPCEDGVARTVYVQREADTFFTIPAAARINGVYTKGYLSRDDEGFTFTAENKDAAE